MRIIVLFSYDKKIVMSHAAPREKCDHRGIEAQCCGGGTTSPLAFLTDSLRFSFRVWLSHEQRRELRGELNVYQHVQPVFELEELGRRHR
jgi:hypothetical protein